MINKSTLDAIKEFFGDEEIDQDWFMRHVSIEMDGRCKTIVITVDNINEQEYSWIEEGIG